MRYPGHHRHHRTIRTILLVGASSFFLVALSLALLKQKPTINLSRITVNADSVAITPLASPVTASPSPNPTPTHSVVTLRLVDGLTHTPLSGQSIAVLIMPGCAADQPCPAVSPQVFTADDEGRINLPPDVVKAKPKLYAAGYKLDTYFSFLDENHPNMLTLYNPPMDDAKTTYDISSEEVLVALTPVE